MIFPSILETPLTCTEIRFRAPPTPRRVRPPGRHFLVDLFARSLGPPLSLAFPHFGVAVSAREE